MQVNALTRGLSRTIISVSKNGNELSIEQIISGSESRWIKMCLHGEEVSFLLKALLESGSDEPQVMKIAKNIARSALEKAGELSRLELEHG